MINIVIQHIRISNARRNVEKFLSGIVVVQTWKLLQSSLFLCNTVLNCLVMHVVTTIHRENSIMSKAL